MSARRIATTATPSRSAPERLLVLVNAPANGDRHTYDAAEIEQCAQRTFGVLERCGLQIQRQPDAMRVTTPADFNRMFPATGGALYGRSSHGWTASFQRPGARTKIPGLYLAGGSTHPGPGVPMAALSGRSAAASLLADLASTKIVPPNGYAWWYVDALSDDGQHGLTIIAFIGSVFSPYYALARRNGPADPLNHCAINVAVYGKGSNRWAMTERPRGAVSRTANLFTVGPSHLSGTANR